MYSFHDGSSGRQQIMNHPNMEVFSQIRALPPRSQSCQLLLEIADFIIASSSCWNKQLCTSLSCFPVFVLCCSVVIFSISHEKFSFSSFILTWIHISELNDGAPHRCGAALQGRGNETNPSVSSKLSLYHPAVLLYNMLRLLVENAQSKCSFCLNFPSLTLQAQARWSGWTIHENSSIVTTCHITRFRYHWLEWNYSEISTNLSV